MKTLATISMMLASTILLSGCSNEEVAIDKPPIVRTMMVNQSRAVVEDQYPGVVRGRYETKLAFQVSGQIMTRNVEIGDRVRSGEILMTINPRDIVQQVNQTDAQVNSAKAQLDLAKADYNRYAELYRAEAVAAAVLDQYRTNYESAVASYNNAVAAANQSRNALDYTELLADFDGVISTLDVESGQIVAAGQTVATLVRTDELEVVIDVPENKIAALSIDQPVTVKFWAMPDRVEGFIREIAPMADAASRTFEVKVSMPNPPRDLQLGMTADVQLRSIERVDTTLIKIPLTAIYQDGDAPTIFIVRGDTVEQRPIKVTSFDGQDALISGVDAGALIVTAGVNKLRAGQRVRVD